MKINLIQVIVFSVITLSFSASASTHEQWLKQQQAKLLPLSERAALRDEIILHRFNTLLPSLMDKNGIDMWVIIAREYNEDPIMKTMLPSSWLSARRRTMLVFYRNPEKTELERLAVAKYDIGNLFKRAWDESAYPQQYDALAALIKARNPEKIAVNRSLTYGLADGLVATDHALLVSALGESLSPRIVSAEPLAVNWLEVRTEKEMAVYKTATEIGHALIARAFSSHVITPSVTTTDDIVWWLREASAALNLENWFHPTIRVQNASMTKDGDFSGKPGAIVVQPGDLLHVDFGITYLGLNTDQQQHAYVLRAGESQAPDSLTQALVVGNQLQDILTDHFKLGRTGNAVLELSREKAIASGIEPMIYTHPIGFHGHAAGTTIGMWDAQEGVAGSGDYPLHANTAYSIELNAAVSLPEWGGAVRIMLEEEAFFDGESVRYIDGRQTQFHLISKE